VRAVQSWEKFIVVAIFPPKCFNLCSSSEFVSLFDERYLRTPLLKWPHFSRKNPPRRWDTICLASDDHVFSVKHVRFSPENDILITSSPKNREILTFRYKSAENEAPVPVDSLQSLPSYVKKSNFRFFCSAFTDKRFLLNPSVLTHFFLRPVCVYLKTILSYFSYQKLREYQFPHKIYMSLLMLSCVIFSVTLMTFWL